MIGTTLDDKYRIERPLGAGAMGAVYSAVDVRTGAEVAVKVIHAHLPAGSTDLVQRFEREARAAGSIDTEHIARCLDIGTDPETRSPYMVLEHLHGEDLHHVLKRTGPLAPDVALRVAAQACRGLVKAHEANVIHRDIKPANIYLDTGPDGARTVKLLDFGVAKIRRDPGEATGDTVGLTRTGSIVGSPLYMSPEQARSVKDLDQRADLWSLGIVIYQCLSGRTPFAHISALGDLIIALCSGPPPPVQQFAPWVSPEVAALLDQLLRVSPSERFQTAEEVLEALLRLLPGGTRLDDAMLVAVDAETRAQIAPTYFRGFGGATAGAAPVPIGGGGTVAMEASAPAARTRENTVVAESNRAGASTESGLSGGASRPGKAPRPLTALGVALGAVACLAAGGAGVYALTRPGPAAVAPAPALPAATSTATAEATATSTATAPASASAAPAVTASASASASAAVPLPSTARAAVRPHASAAPSATPRIDHTVFGDRK